MFTALVLGILYVMFKVAWLVVRAAMMLAVVLAGAMIVVLLALVLFVAELVVAVEARRRRPWERDGLRAGGPGDPLGPAPQDLRPWR